jgi:DNA-directed RNA polymerase specialized sigma24 family protein
MSDGSSMQMSDGSSMQLVVRWRAGDQQAARELFWLYAARLIALVRSRLSAQLAQRVDPEDLVQSAYRSFFCGARAGDYDVRRSGDLWRLLVRITLHKLQDQVKFHRRAKRAVGRERDLGVEGPPVELLAAGPSPLEAIALVDEVAGLMQLLGSVHGRMLELRLQGHDLEEIARATRRSVRTVRRVLDGIKQQLEQRLVDSAAEDKGGGAG